MSNKEHQVILNMCARIHELTPQKTQLLTSAYLRASKIVQGVEVAAADIYTSKLVQLVSGRIVVVVHNDTGLGVMLVTQNDTTQARFLKMLNDDISDEAFDDLAASAEAIVVPDEFHVVEKFKIPGGVQEYSISTNPKNGLSAAVSPQEEDPALFQLWNTERYEDRTSTYSIQYWSPLTAARQTPPTRTPYEQQEA